MRASCAKILVLRVLFLNCEKVMNLDLREFYKLLVRPTVIISTVSPNGVSNLSLIHI